MIITLILAFANLLSCANSIKNKQYVMAVLSFGAYIFLLVLLLFEALVNRGGLK